MKMGVEGVSRALQAIVRTLAYTLSPCRVWAKQRCFLSSSAALWRVGYKTRSRESSWE